MGSEEEGRVIPGKQTKSIIHCFATTESLLAHSLLASLVGKQREKRIRELLAICSLQNCKGA